MQNEICGHLAKTDVVFFVNKGSLPTRFTEPIRSVLPKLINKRKGTIKGKSFKLTCLDILSKPCHFRILRASSLSSNTNTKHDGVSSHYQTPSVRHKCSTTRRIQFQLLFLVFRNRMKHCDSCLTYYIIHDHRQ